MNEEEKRIIEKTSIPLEGGGDTHIHPFGKKKDDFVVTTRIPVGDGSVVDIHDKPEK